MAITFEVAWNEGPLSVGTEAKMTTNYKAKSDDAIDATDKEDRVNVLNQMVAQLPDEVVIDEPDGISLRLEVDTYSVSDRLSDENKESYWDCSITYVDSGSKKGKPIQPPKPGDTERLIRWTYKNGSPKSVLKTQSLRAIAEKASEGYKFAQQTPEVASYLGWHKDTKGDSVDAWEVTGVQMPLTGVEIGLEIVANNDEIVNTAYLVGLSEAAARNVVNELEWFGYPPGTLKFTAFSAKQRSGEKQGSPNENAWDLNCTFQYSPEEVIDTNGFIDDAQHPAIWWNLETNKADNTIKKGGHQYLDVTWQSDPVQGVVGAGAGDPEIFAVPKILRMVLHELHDELQFAALFEAYPYVPYPPPWPTTPQP